MTVKKRPSVAIGISGGVDSSAAAALMVARGYDCVGMFMHYWTEGGQLGLAKRENECCSLEGYEDARRVCTKLGIPLYTFNLKDVFKEQVVDQWLADYEAGLTPNPCVRCNRLVRFGDFLDKVKTLGVDYLATGHYIKKTTDRHGVHHLWEAKDASRDQSYFLAQLSQDSLSRLLFPLGDKKKPAVRRYVAKQGLPTAQKTESHEICFIKEKGHGEFLKRHLALNPGEIVLEDGVVVGQHYGLPMYTLGQRKGVGLGGGPYFVIGKDTARNRLIVTKDENSKKLFAKQLTARDVSFISGTPPVRPLRCRARIRYHHPAVPATVTCSGDSCAVVFDTPQRAVTAGQAVVFYQPHWLTGRLEALGGGTITPQ